MAYLQLKSNNPNFSYILKKNPQSGMLIKENGKGRLFAWYTNPEIFNIYFRDSDTEVSYGGKDKEFEYMDETRYNAPMFLFHAFNEFLKHMKKHDDKDIPGYENMLMLNQIKCRPRSLDAFKSNFTDYDIEFEEVSFHNYKITIKTQKTLQELISVGQLLSIFNALLTDNLFDIAEQDIDKYMNLLQVIDAPYYIRHLFKLYFLKTNKVFNKYKSLLEVTKRENLKMEFEFGSTLTQRINAIRKLLDFNGDIIDIGCGDGNYVREFAPRIDENAIYHAIDTNQEYLEKVQKLCERKQIENVVTYTSFDEFTKTVSTVNSCPAVLLTEVIEHMTKEEASELILEVLKLPFQKLIITTPNKDFNGNYKLYEDDTRHEEHKFEMTRHEFMYFINGIILKSGFFVPGSNDIFTEGQPLRFFEIGDKVNDVQPTLAVVIRGKEEMSK